MTFTMPSACGVAAATAATIVVLGASWAVRAVRTYEPRRVQRLWVLAGACWGAAAGLAAWMAGTPTGWTQPFLAARHWPVLPFALIGGLAGAGAACGGLWLELAFRPRAAREVHHWAYFGGAVGIFVSGTIEMMVHIAQLRHGDLGQSISSLTVVLALGAALGAGVGMIAALIVQPLRADAPRQARYSRPLRWSQFTLQSLLLAMLLTAIVLGILAWCQQYRKRHAVADLEDGVLAKCSRPYLQYHLDQVRLCHCSDAAVASMTQLLRHKDHRVRARAFFALSALTPDAGEILARSCEGEEPEYGDPEWHPP